MELESGESRQFDAGDVILLEDAIQPGHRMVVAENNEMTVLFIALKSPLYRTGRNNSALQKLVTSVQSCSLQGDSVVRSSSPQLIFDTRMLRVAVVGTLALSLSVAVADILSKSVPLWLSVGFGGACFVTGMTWAVTSAVEWMATRLALWRERRRLRV